MDTEKAAVDRIYAIIQQECTATDISQALGSDTVEAASETPKASDLLQMLVAGLHLHGARKFLELTTTLVCSPSANLIRKRTVAVYGGAFDPITNAHLMCASEIIHSQCADEVWLVPCGPRPDKPALTTPFFDRYCMCQIAVNTVFMSAFPVRVSDAEFHQKEAFSTYDLLCCLRDANPDVDFCFVIGSDWLQKGTDLSGWKSINKDWKEGDPEEARLVVTGHKLLNEFDFLVIPRPGYDMPDLLEQFGPRMKSLTMPEGVTLQGDNLSSSEIRKRSAVAARVRDAIEGQSLHIIDGLVPRGVLSYILKWGFYLDKHHETQERRHVAIYGGAFDPITNAHMTCAAEIVHSGCADEVWFVPCGPRPDKPSLKTPALDRLCMAKIALSTVFTVDFPVRVSHVECFATEAFYTYDLLCTLREQFPHHRFSFVIGSDWLQPGTNLAEWPSKNKDWKPGDPQETRTVVTGHKMLQEFDFLVIRRPGYSVDPTPEDPSGLQQFGPRLKWLTMPPGTSFVQGTLSSSEVRKRIASDTAKHKPYYGIDGLIPTGVLSYILRNQLYPYN